MSASDVTLHLEYRESPRFDISNEEEAVAMLQHLEDHGYAVVAGVASSEQIEAAKCSFWDFWEATTPELRRDDASTWDKHWMCNPQNGIAHTFYGAAHSEFNWNTRTLPAVKESFSKIWETQELIVSFDGSNAFRPWKVNRNWLTDGGWYHVDQNSLNGESRQGRVCVQGLVTYYDVTADSGGFCAIPGSHKLHEQICNRTNMRKSKYDFVPLKKDDPVLFAGARNRATAAAAALSDADVAASVATASTEDGVAATATTTTAATAATTSADGAATAAVEEEEVLMRKLDVPILVGARAGDLILWDSRTVHCNSPALTVAEYFANAQQQQQQQQQQPQQQQQQAAELIRLVAYVCMVPRSVATADVLESRKVAFTKQLATSHWPAQLVNTELITTAKQPLDPDDISQEVLQLVGYDCRSTTSKCCIT